MVSLNATGILGRDAVCFAMQDKYVVNFSIASNKAYKDANGVRQTKTTWVECAYFSKTDAIVQWLKKGTIVSVQGNPEINVFAKQDGSQGYSLKCIVNEIDFFSQNKPQ